tara:strand:+ start:5618 stop:6163 length:546 start_codon:yes stop_codon:yes gene_type:complete
MSSSNQSLVAETIIRSLNLEPHEEGGFFRRTYAATIAADSLDSTVAMEIGSEGERRAAMSSIYYLLTATSPIGHFHQNRSDIVHYFHLGDPIRYVLIHPDGRLETAVIGSDLEAGQQLQLTVPGGVWKASQISTEGYHGYGLISEAVVPEFHYVDMTMGKLSELLALFPQHEAVLRRLSLS